MNTIQLIKEHFPEMQHKERKQFANVFEYQSKVANRPIIEYIKAAREDFLKQKSKDMLLLLNKMFATGLLIETNDLLEGTTLQNYHCKITGGIGKRFMNAQYNLYNNEYNDMLSTQNENGNYIISQIERGVKLLSNAISKEHSDIFDIMEMMQEDEVLFKRVIGLSKSHKKGK